MTDVKKVLAFAKKWLAKYDEADPARAYYLDMYDDAREAGLEIDEYVSFIKEIHPDWTPENVNFFAFKKAIAEEVEKCENIQAIGNLIYTKWREDTKGGGYNFDVDWYINALDWLEGLCEEELENGQNRGKIS